MTPSCDVPEIQAQTLEKWHPEGCAPAVPRIQETVQTDIAYKRLQGPTANPGSARPARSHRRRRRRPAQGRRSLGGRAVRGLSGQAHMSNFQGEMGAAEVGHRGAGSSLQTGCSGFGPAYHTLTRGLWVGSLPRPLPW